MIMWIIAGDDGFIDRDDLGATARVVSGAHPARPGTSTAAPFVESILA